MRPTLIATMSQTDLLRIAAQFGLAARELAKATADAVNDTAKKARGETRKRVRAYVNLPANRINTAIDINVRAKPDSPSATVVLDKHAKGRSERPSLISFGGKPGKPHYEGKAHKKRRAKAGGAKPSPAFSYQVLKAGPRKILPGGFVARPTRRGLGAGSPGVSRQITDGSGAALAFVRRGKPRYPLNVPKGPSVAALWQNDENGIRKDIMAELGPYLAKRVQGQAQRIYDAKWKKVNS